ncbi:hypothetical protein [Putridiphycobacter roseus]|uniref:hypothetical protein n=1 Tax=Putridiphycobacter roseus TaxID=2219161 RepID=UPI000DA8122C
MGSVGFGMQVPVAVNSFDKLFVKAQDSTRNRYLTILKMKCNPCHIQKKRPEIFTAENLDLFAQQIRDQVIEKKRMPKGKKYNLTPEEFHIIKQYLVP